MSKTPYVSGEAESADGQLAKFPDWREGVAILMERAWLGVLIASLVFLAFFFQARRQTPCYRSTATLLVIIFVRLAGSSFSSALPSLSTFPLA